MAEIQTHDVTALLVAWRSGDDEAVQALLPLVHHELRHLARRYMAGERAGHVLQPTALVNETYLRLVDARRVDWRDRAHFFAMAARLMRRVLVDTARAQRNQKRGGAFQRVSVELDLAAPTPSREELLAVDQALRALAEESRRKAEVVELRFFAGLSVEETAEVLEVSPETVMRDWRFARAWLRRRLERCLPSPDD